METEKVNITKKNLKLSNVFKGDKVLWNAIIVLSIISITAVYSATGALAYQDGSGGNTLFYLIKHSIFIGVGLLFVVIFQYIDYKNYIKYAEIILYVSLFLSVLTLFVGVEINGARRWLRIPFIGVLFQPSELAKFAVVIFASKVLAVKQATERGRIAAIKKVLGHVLPVVALTIFADLSSALLMIVTTLVVMYAGRVKIKYILGIIVLSIIIGAGVYSLGKMKRGDTWNNRITSFISGQSTSKQPANAKAAIATGGFFGKGPGNSEARNVLPQTYSDFIYAFIIEEYGFFGGALLLSVYIWIFIRGITLVQGMRKAFPALLSLGLIISLTIQALVNMSVSVGLAPVTGQTLPFVSMGGTSVVFTALAFGIILNVSRHNKISGNTKKQINTDETK